MTEPLPPLPDAPTRKHYRQMMGVTLEQAAAQLQVTSRAILRWEHGSTPNPGNHRRYAALLQEWADKIHNQ